MKKLTSLLAALLAVGIVIAPCPTTTPTTNVIQMRLDQISAGTSLIADAAGVDNALGVCGVNAASAKICCDDAKTKAEASTRLDAWRESVPATMKKGKKSFAPLLTATKNWRLEMLAVFDYPITNGYTEALNGVAKVINRQGRGYSFEVLRARLLFGKKPSKHHIEPVLDVEEEIAPCEAEAEAKPKRTSARWKLIEKYDYRCQSCGGIYDQEELHATRMGVMFSDQPMTNLTLMCSHCKVRFHTDGAIHGGPLSTL